MPGRPGDGAFPASHPGRVAERTEGGWRPETRSGRQKPLPQRPRICRRGRGQVQAQVPCAGDVAGEERTLRKRGSRPALPVARRRRWLPGLHLSAGAHRPTAEGSMTPGRHPAGTAVLKGGSAAGVPAGRGRQVAPGHGRNPIRRAKSAPANASPEPGFGSRRHLFVQPFAAIARVHTRKGGPVPSAFAF